MSGRILPRKPIASDLEWVHDAECLGADPDIFFPDRGESPNPARAICAFCPVKDECREHGIQYEKRGVWGGLSERERKVIRAERKLKEPEE